MTYSSEAHPEPKPLKDDGILILFLGKESPAKKYVDLHYTDGSVVRYWVDVTAAVPMHQRSSSPYASMTKSELRAEVNAKGIAVPKYATKDQLREALEG